MFRLFHRGHPPLTPDKTVDKFLRSCESSGLTPETLQGYRERLQYLGSYCVRIGVGVLDLRRDHLERYVLACRGKVADETINGRLRVYRVFFRWLQETGLKKANPMSGIRLLRIRHRVKPVFTEEDARKVLNLLSGGDFISHRNRCMFLVLYDGMCRSKELRSIRTRDVFLDQGLIYLNHTKNRKERYIPLSGYTIEQLRSYLTTSRANIAGELVFCQSDGTAINRTLLSRTFNRIGKRIGLEVNLGPHMCRRSGASRYIEQNGNPEHLREILGHEDPKMLKYYVNIKPESLADAHRLHSPVRGIE